MISKSKADDEKTEIREYLFENSAKVCPNWGRFAKTHEQIDKKFLLILLIVHLLQNLDLSKLSLCL